MKTKINVIAMAIGLVSLNTSATTPSMANENRSAQAMNGEMVTAMVSPTITKKTFSFNDLGYGQSIQLKGSESTAYIGFGSRLDEVVSQASLHFELTPSPALLSLVSHIKVYFNNELAGVVAINNGMQGKSSAIDLNLDPRLFTDYNQLKFELVGNAS